MVCNAILWWDVNDGVLTIKPFTESVAPSCPACGMRTNHESSMIGSLPQTLLYFAIVLEGTANTQFSTSEPRVGTTEHVLPAL
jgi:hypothetical protein